MSRLGGWAGYRVGQWRHELRVERLRLACPRCGPRLERLEWLDPHARVTRRLAASVARLCAVTSVLHAARWHGIDWKTAKAIDFRARERDLGPMDLEGVRRLAMDEFALQKGHRYATVVVDVERKRVDAANRLRHDKPARKVVKHAHWLLLRNPETLKKTDQVCWPPTSR